MVKRTMVKCAAPGCKRLVFPKEKYCWPCKLERRNERLKRLKNRGRMKSPCRRCGYCKGQSAPRSRRRKLWYIVDQEKIRELNDAVNDQWAFIVGLEELSRWNTCSDILQLRENLEKISELLAESIIWEEFA